MDVVQVSFLLTLNRYLLIVLVFEKKKLEKVNSKVRQNIGIFETMIFLKKVRLS